MIRAYDEICLGNATDSLGRMLDFAVHSMRIDAAQMMKLFIASGTAAYFGRGDMRLICGMSGIELTYEVLERSGLEYERATPRHTVSLSNEYWCGYALAYAQWSTAMSFDELLSSCSVSGLIADCGRERLALLESLPLDISEAERSEELRRFGRDFAESTAAKLSSPISGTEAPGGTALGRMRARCGLSQSALARASGVPLRTIQQYEQRQKDINKANFEYIAMLSAALSCDPASLLEHH